MVNLQYQMPADRYSVGSPHMAHALAQENDCRHCVCLSSAPHPSSEGSGKVRSAVLSRRLGPASRRLGKPREQALGERDPFKSTSCSLTPPNSCIGKLMFVLSLQGSLEGDKLALGGLWPADLPACESSLQ